MNIRLIFLLLLCFGPCLRGAIQVSHRTDLNLLSPLRLTLTPGPGEMGRYRIATLPDGKERKLPAKAEAPPSAWVEFSKPVTCTLAPMAERIYAVEYEIAGAGGAFTSAGRQTYRIYRFNNPLPRAKTDELQAQGLALGRNVLHDQFNSAAMGPRPNEMGQLDPCVVGFNVYLPEDYYTNPDRSRRYPVVYYLHGGRGNENSLLPELPVIQRAIAQKLIPPMIVVMAQGGSGAWFYHDHCRSNPRVMIDTSITQELLEAVEARYRVRRDAGGRAIAGFSMGGFGALKYAFGSSPPLYSSVVAFSPGLEGMGNGMASAQIEAGITDHNAEIYDLVRRHSAEIGRLGVFITHGEKGKDLIAIIKGTDGLLAQMQAAGLPCTSYVLPIGHGQEASWKQKGEEALRFIASHFH